MADIDYTSKDFLGLRQFMLERKRESLPEWTSESPADLGVVLIEAMAYTGDILSFYIDRVANEAYLATATQRRSILLLAEALDYAVTHSVPATVDVQFNVSADVTIPAGTQIQTSSVAALNSGEEPVVFEVVDDILVTAPNGNVACVEGITVSDESVGTSDGSVDQEFSLFRFPVIQDTVQIFVDEGSGPVEWTRFDHLIDASNVTEGFSVRFDETGAATISFGDNVNGRVPGSGATITATYRVGGGERGNVGVGTLTELIDEIAEVTSVTNPNAASAGADAETNDQIRVNAPKSLRSLYRGVSLEDYANLAVQVSGIAKANATAAGTAVTVYLAPLGGGAASASKKTQVQSYLDERKMFNHTVTLADPTYLDITIEVDVHVKDNYSKSAVEEAVETALAEMLAFSKVDFAHRVSVSMVYEMVHSVEGVSYASLTTLSTGGAGVADVVPTATQIPREGTVTVTTTGGITGT